MKLRNGRLNRIVECADAAGSKFTVTGYKHLLRLGSFAGIRIVTPADFLDISEGKRRGKF